MISVDNASGLKRVTALTGHQDKVTDLAFSPDGKYIASASYDRTLRLWDVQAGVEVHQIPVRETDLNAIALSRCPIKVR
jgi:WD40 repeat protein